LLISWCDAKCYRNVIVPLVKHHHDIKEELPQFTIEMSIKHWWWFFVEPTYAHFWNIQIGVLLNPPYTHFCASFLCSWYVSWTNFPNNTLTFCLMRNMSLFNSHVQNMMFFTCCLCFAIIWNIVSQCYSCSITRYLICSNKRTTYTNLSPILKSPWTCKPSWLTWFRWMKHNFDTCLSKYNVLMVNLTLHPLFIEPPHFFLEFHVPLWLVLDGITFPRLLELHYGFV
jgi:hypothetical protein